MLKDFVIVVQGGCDYIHQIKSSLVGLPIIYSTWKGQEDNFNEDEIVIFNEYPTDHGPSNFNLQKVSTISGLKKAKELGYKRALKLRSDMVIENSLKFFSLIDNEYMNFISWHFHEVYPGCPGYLIDFLMSGDIDDLIKLWDIEDYSWCSVPEILITDNYCKTLQNEVKINFILDEFNEDNDIYWIKRDIHLRTYQNEIIKDPYKKYKFGNTYDFLNQDYSNFLK